MNVGVLVMYMFCVLCFMFCVGMVLLTVNCKKRGLLKWPSRGDVSRTRPKIINGGKAAL